MIDLESKRPTTSLSNVTILKRTLLLFCLLGIFLDYTRRLNGTATIKLPSSFLFYLSSNKTESAYPNEPQEATILSATELLARPLATDLNTVPKLFHQSWATSELPEKFEKWSRSCRRAHPDWEWVLWTDEDNQALVEKYVSWFNETYASFEENLPVYRADMARNMYMHVFGGVYADLDVECLLPTSSLLSTYHQPGRQAFLGRMGSDSQLWEPSLPNAWFASSPGHPFWLLPLEYVQDHKDDTDLGRNCPEDLTGPRPLFNVVGEYHRIYSNGDDALDKHYAESGWGRLYDHRSLAKSVSESTEAIANMKEHSQQPLDHDIRSSAHSVTILPWWEIYPFSWQRDGDAVREICWTVGQKFDEERCKLLLGTDHWGSHTITYWSHVWGHNGEQGFDQVGFESVTGDGVDEEVDD